MIDHTSFSVNNFEESTNFYDQTLAQLGYQRLMTFDDMKVAGYGHKNKPAFWISAQDNQDEEIGKARGVHFAFLAQSVESVNNWYKKCLELGGKNNGAPGPRKKYHPSYYGAFIIDPNGWHIEACFHNYKGD